MLTFNLNAFNPINLFNKLFLPELRTQSFEVADLMWRSPNLIFKTDVIW
jgi:hypothetical protein